MAADAAFPALSEGQWAEWDRFRRFADRMKPKSDLLRAGQRALATMVTTGDES
jgi:hypothetical protein